MPALGVTVYVNEAARREHHPINCRAMALWWLYSADPTQYPIFLGDVVLASTGDEEEGSLMERIVGDVFEQREFVIQVKPYGRGPWHDSFARFTDVFDAATWSMLLVSTFRSGALLRLESRAPASESHEDLAFGGEQLW